MKILTLNPFRRFGCSTFSLCISGGYGLPWSLVFLPETDVVEENEQFDEVELQELIDPGERFADDSSDDDEIIIDEEVLDAQDSESDIWLSSITIGKDKIKLLSIYQFINLTFK